MTRRFILFLTLASFLWFETALASLYPTQPIASTVYKAASQNNLTWIDTQMEPSLDKLGPLEIQLWQSDTQHMANLAENVDAKKKFLSVYIPGGLCLNGSDYVIRFYSEEPKYTYYTSKFRIEDTNNKKDDCPAANLRRPQATSVGHLDIVTVTMSTTTSAPTEHNAKVVSTGNATSGAASSRNLYERRPKTDVRSSLGFIFWPALFGLAMAF